MNLIGLDVGFSAKRCSTGWARLNGSNLSCGRTTSKKQDRICQLGKDIADVTAIDGPLLCKYHSNIRTCEQIFSMGKFSRRCKPGFSHVIGTGIGLRKAGKETAEQLADLTSGKYLPSNFPRMWANKNLVEAFPNTFLGVILPDKFFDGTQHIRRGKKSDWLYDKCINAKSLDLLLDSIGLTYDLQSLNENKKHDEKAALICLLTAAFVAKGQYTAVGDNQGGYFFLPPWNAWSDWAKKELDIQRERLDCIEVWINGKCFGATKAIPTTV